MAAAAPSAPAIALPRAAWRPPAQAGSWPCAPACTPRRPRRRRRRFSSVILVSRLLAITEVQGSTGLVAQSFRTGDNSAGYTLSSVVVTLTGSSDPHTVTAQVRTNTTDSNNNPSSTVVADLTVPSSLPGAGTFTDVELMAPSGTMLSSNTVYYLVLSGPRTNWVDIATSLGEDAGTASGWEFPYASRVNLFGTLWSTPDSGAFKQRMQVRGTAIADTTPPTLDTAAVKWEHADADLR